ncbi:MAG TPA: HNH endonuclease, partial [Jiangellales bacterium]|nr:HNH endonuclease [Jiangellales bacterium]
MSTLIGLDDAPGELVGHGAVPAAVARELAASARVWQRLLTDPVDGHLVTQAIRCYRPDAAIAAFVRARGGVCAARGCTARHGLQIDHDTPWPHGPTSAGNMVLRHGSHHQPKTDRIWRHRLDPDTGALSQISPLGRR